MAIKIRNVLAKMLWENISKQESIAEKISCKRWRNPVKKIWGNFRKRRKKCFCQKFASRAPSKADKSCLSRHSNKNYRLSQQHKKYISEDTRCHYCLVLTMFCPLLKKRCKRPTSHCCFIAKSKFRHLVTWNFLQSTNRLDCISNAV